MDQLVKDKLNADKNHRDEVLDLKEHIAQLEAKLHLDTTSADLNVRRKYPKARALRYKMRTSPPRGDGRFLWGYKSRTDPLMRVNKPLGE